MPESTSDPYAPRDLIRVEITAAASGDDDEYSVGRVLAPPGMSVVEVITRLEELRQTWVADEEAQDSDFAQHLLANGFIADEAEVVAYRLER